MDTDKVTNVIIAGLGGQGVLKASDVLAETVFQAGYDVKKSEVHGMSQRGGSVCSDVRFGRVVYSPMVPLAEADYLVVLASDQIEPNRHMLGPSGVLIHPGLIEAMRLVNRGIPHFSGLVDRGSHQVLAVQTIVDVVDGAHVSCHRKY